MSEDSARRLRERMYEAESILTGYDPDFDVPEQKVVRIVRCFVADFAWPPGEDGPERPAETPEGLAEAVAEVERGDQGRGLGRMSEDGREFVAGQFYWLTFGKGRHVAARCLTTGPLPEWELPGRLGPVDAEDFAEAGATVEIGEHIPMPGAEPK